MDSGDGAVLRGRLSFAHAHHRKASDTVPCAAGPLAAVPTPLLVFPPLPLLATVTLPLPILSFLVLTTLFSSPTLRERQRRDSA